MGVHRGDVTATALVGLAGLHVAWGLGSSFPLSDRAALADVVVGSGEVPPPAMCHAVAGALVGAAALVADIPVGWPGLRRLGRRTVATVLAGRALLGFVARTDLVSPASTSPGFRRMDRRLYSPLCLTLAVGAATAAER